MFGKNEIVGQRYFNDAGQKLFVTSMFMTLQGEGPFAGKPAFFIRLAKCNLACSFCDTFFDDGDWLTVPEIFEKIEQTIENHYNDIGTQRPGWTLHDDNNKKRMVLVMTGGEPLLQSNIGSFLDEASKVFQNTQIESNGIVYQDIPSSTVLVISPKCAEKQGVATKYLKPNVKNLERADCLKFVMSADEDSPYNTVPDWALEAGRQGKDIYVSPMNIYNDEPANSKEIRNNGSNRIEIEERSTVDEVISFWEEGLLNMQENKKNHEYAAKYALSNGLTLNLQIHLYASLA